MSEDQAPKAEPGIAAEPVVESTAPPKLSTVTVVMRRPGKLGERELEIGDPIAEVTLSDCVDLNSLVDTIRSGFAGELIEEEE